MSDLTVADLMSTALITVGPKDSVNRADLEMKLAGIRHFPVVDGRQHLVGVVSDRDLLRGFGRTDVVSIASVMTTDVHTVSEETPAAEAVELLLEHKFGCLPVVGDDGRLVGLVTETDFLRVAHRALLNSADLGR
jgi:CBS domain-containing protein